MSPQTQCSVLPRWLSLRAPNPVPLYIGTERAVKPPVIQNVHSGLVGQELTPIRRLNTPLEMIGPLWNHHRWFLATADPLTLNSPTHRDHVEMGPEVSPRFISPNFPQVAPQNNHQNRPGKPVESLRSARIAQNPGANSTPLAAARGASFLLPVHPPGRIQTHE